MPSLDEALGSVGTVDAAVDAVGEQGKRLQLLRSSTAGAVHQNPDDYAEALRIERTTGMPAPAVVRNLDDVRKRLQVGQYDQLLTTSPKLAGHMSDPNFASTAHDDTEPLSALEQAVTNTGAPGWRATPQPEPTLGNYLSGLWNSTVQGGRQAGLGLDLQMADLLDKGTLEDQAYRADLLRKYEQASGRLEGGTPGFESRTASGIYSGFSSALQQAPGIGLSLLMRNPAPALATMGGQVEAQAYGKYRVRGATPGEALLGAAGEGVVEVATEKIPMGFLVNKLGKVGAGEFLTGLLAREVPSEQVATFVQDAIDTAVANPDKTWEQFLAERPDAAYQTLLATLVQSGLMEGAHVTVHHLAGEQQKAAQAQQDAATLAAVSQAAQASKLRERDPESFQAFVNNAAGGTPIENLHLDAQTLQQSGVDMAALAQASPAAAAQLPQALATGSDIVIPLGEFATKIAGTPLEPALTPHLRTNEDAMSQFEAQTYAQGQAEQFQTAAKQAMEEHVGDTAWQQSAAKVETQLFDQLQTAGRFTKDVNSAYATLMRDFYVATASRLGITPEEMLQRYPINVRAESVLGDVKMEQNAAEAAGFDGSTLWLHGTAAGRDFKSFKKGDGELGPGVYITQTPLYANAWAKGDNARVMPLRLKRGDVFDLTQLKTDPQQYVAGAQERVDAAYRGIADRILAAGTLPPTLQDMTADQLAERIKSTNNSSEALNRWLEMAGYVGAADRTSQVPDQVVVFNPANLRSVNAKFDPRKADSKHILAQDGVANAKGSGQNADSTLNQGVNDGTRTDRPGLPSDQDVHTTVAGGPPREGWAEATRVRRTDGKPATVYRGAGRELSAADFERDALGHATNNPSSSLGVWFTAHRDEASRWGDVEPFNLDIRKPKVFKIEDLPGFDSGEEAFAFREQLRAEGYDGIAVDARHVGGPVHFVAFTSETVINPPSAPSLDFTQFFQSEQRSVSLHALANEGDNQAIVAQALVDGASSLSAEQLGDALVRVASLPQSDSLRSVPAFGAVLTEMRRVVREQPEILDAIVRTPPVSVVNNLFGGQLAAKMALHNEAMLQNSPAFNTDLSVAEASDAARAISLFVDQVARMAAKRFAASNAGREARERLAAGGAGQSGALSQGGSRAEISFSKDITSAPSVISLFETADLSSLLHEMGHFQLEVLTHIASQPDAPPEIAKDVDAVLSWFKPGMTLADWQGMSLEDKRPYHEQFARGFEAYLFEGKAPNTELKSLFQRFRAWLITVYKSVKALNVEISDDIRGVFDRLVAAQDTIQAAEAQRAMTPMFADDAELQRLGAQATADAQDELQQRGLKDMQWLQRARGRVLKELQADAKAKRQAVEDEVRAEVRAQPVYAAQRFLRYGELPEANRSNAERKVLDDLAGRPIKLSLEDLKSMYGEGAAAPWRYLPTGKNGIAATDGVHPDLIAELFAYTSGDQLVREIIAAQPESEVVEGMTDQRVLERHGDISSMDTLARAADEAIHNEARARFVATELKAITKATGPARTIAAAAKAFAEASIARKRVRDIKPNQHAIAETRAAKAAQVAMAKGDTTQAAVEKRNQLVQNYSTKISYEALAEIEKAVKYLRKLDGEGVRKNLDTEYIDQIDQLLERYDLRKSTSNKDAAKRASLLEWVESQREQGLEPDVPPELLTDAQRKPYRELTLEELRGLVDTVKQIEHLGRLKHKLLTAKEQREFDTAVTEIITSIDANANGRTAETRTPTDTLGKLAASLKRFWASHIKAATWARVMDGGKDGGPMWEYFIRTANERGDQETEARSDATKSLSAILAPVVKTWPKVQGKGRYFESVGRPFTREGALALALNTGNAGNLQRLLGGEGWTFAQIQPILQSLTAQEWRAVQAIWDHFETYRPQIAAKEKRIYGKEPDWVEPAPFTVQSAGGEAVDLKGGYYPIKYDPAASQRAEEHADAEEARAQLRGAYTAATTRRSFTKARAEEVSGRPLLYSLVGVFSGTNDVIHDLAWHEWLIDANKLLRSKSIDHAIRTQYGPQVKDQFKQWVKDVAQGETRADHPAEQAVAWLRQGVSAAGLGFNVMSAIMQVTGLPQSIVRVGPTWIGRGIAQAVANPIGKAREINSKSEFMAARSRTQFRELNELRNQVGGQSEVKRFLTLGTYFLMMRAQKMVDVPTWLGAYEKAIAEGQNEERSIALADQAVIDAQGSGLVKDLSTVERGGQALKLFTVFYSYMNTALNAGVAVGMTERNKAKLAAKMLMLYTVPAVLGYALKSALTPGGGDDDPEKTARKLAAAQLDYLSGLMVGVREFGEVGRVMAGAEGARDYAGPAGVRLVGDVLKTAQQARQGEFDDAFRKASINLLGDLTGLPSAQINRTITGVEALAEDKTDNPAAAVLGYQH